MTIAIAIAVPDGIALAADTQVTWSQTIVKAIEKGTGKEFELERPISIPIGWAKMSRKLFPLKFKEYQFTVCVAGVAILNSKTIYSIFKSMEKAYSGNQNPKDIIDYLAKGIKDQFKLHYKTEELSRIGLNILEFIISGYENQDVSKPFIESHMVFSGEININGKKDTSGHRVTWGNSDQTNRYGGCWIGRQEFISHIISHKNNQLPPIQGQFGFMTLADAIDYTKFLVNFTCDFQRFAIMVPDCGRPIISATLTPEEYKEEIIY